MRKLFRQGKRFGVVAMAILLSGGLLLSSVLPAKAAEERVVRLGILGVLTGPAANTGVPLTYGVIDYYHHVNDQGGINGVKIETLWEDTRLEVPRAISAHKRFSARGIVAEWSTDATQCETLAPLCQRDELPIIGINAFNPPMWTAPLRWVILGVPSWACTAQITLDWIMKNWTEARPPRVAYLCWDHPTAWGTGNGLRDYAPQVGVDFVSYEKVPPLATVDTTTEWLRTVAKKPDWVIVFAVGTTMVTLVKDADRLEVRDKGIKLFGCPSSIDDIAMKVMRKSVEGWYTTFPLPVNTQTELPGMKTVLEAGAKYRGYKPEEVPMLYIGSWIIGMVTVEAVRLAIEQVGYENITGRAVRDAACSIKDFDIGLVPKITVTNERPWLVERFWIFIVREERLWVVDEGTISWYPKWLQEKLMEQ